MTELFPDARFVDAVLLFMLAECALLLWWSQRSGRGPGATALVTNLLAGAGLLLAMRLAMSGVGWPWLAIPLLGSGVAHLLDLRERWRASPPRERGPASSAPRAMAGARGESR